MKDIYIHLGLHKTASTFLQKQFFKNYSSKCGYLDLRTECRSFLDYVLHCNDINYNAEKARHYFWESLKDKPYLKKVTISDEQLCGSPWNDAKDRKLYFDRLNGIFPNAKYIIVFRNQEDLTESLYLQYIKKGGSASINKFLDHKRHPLEFARKSYLDYGSYVNYITKNIDKERLLCLYYEDMKKNPIRFLNDIASYIDFSITDDIKRYVHKKENKSIHPFTIKVIVPVNKLFSSMRQPFNLLPSRIRNCIIRFILLMPSRSKNEPIYRSAICNFCKDPKKNNHILSEISARDLKNIGY